MKSVASKNIFLFSGHMVDHGNRKRVRFPPFLAKKVKKVIKKLLKTFNAGSNDIALTQGACGGDLLFTEASLELDLQVEWVQPYKETQFIKKSLAPCGSKWIYRYRKCRKKIKRVSSLTLYETTKASSNRYTLTNHKLLQLALTYAQTKGTKVYCIVLWDGKKSTKPGGTAKMVDNARKSKLPILWIDTQNLLFKGGKNAVKYL
jgi:hypothetical protein